MNTASTEPPGEGGADSARLVCTRIFDALSHGDLSDFQAIFHPDAVNRESDTQPPAARQSGPSAFYATALWLREALADMHWELNEVVAQGDLIVAHTTGHARQTGPFVFYDSVGQVEQVFPPTGRTTSDTQTHWFRIADGKVIEHWANRDDMGMARRLGWIPPSPRYLLRMTVAKRQARRTRKTPPAA
jgi:predicted ester cyclase